MSILTEVTPGQVAVESNDVPGLHIEFLDFRDRSHGPLRADEVSASIDAGRFVWIDVDTRHRDPRAIFRILPPVVRVDYEFRATDEEDVSKLRRGEGHLQITLVGLVEIDQGIVGQRLDIVIGEGFLVTLHQGPSAVLHEVRRDYITDFQRFAATPSFLVYEIWNDQVDQFLRIQNRFEQRVEAIRLKLRSSADEETLHELADVTGQLLSLRRHCLPARRVLEEVVSRKTTLISDATFGFLGRMIGTLERLLADIGSDLEILESAMNFTLTVTSHRTNMVMNRLAVVSTIFLPLTFICGVYGMNFEGIPEIEWTHGYAFFWSISTAITIALVFLLRRAKLL